ncbi:MAG: hypothetical protein OYK82_08325 [Gammaproteobacteria bacterium]|nr:hypothetical protein [Gammaproteobacteria bacterium]
MAQISAKCASQASPLLQGICRDGVLALRALHGGTGLLMTGGGALPASPSTVGRRLPGSPRIVVDLGATWARFSYPGLSYTASGTATEEQSVLAGGRATAVMGVFDGFSPVTGVGGILAVDAVAGVKWVRVPDSPVGPGSTLGWGGGLRIGVFRESFSLPGITFSATHDRAGALRYGTEEEPGAWVELEPAVTSFRAIAGKDLWPVGLSVGIGWDLYRGAGRIEARLAAEGDRQEVVATRSRDLSLDRRYLFAGLNYTWVVTQVAAEVTWTQAATPSTSLHGTGPFQPGDRELQGAVTLRLIY